MLRTRARSALILGAHLLTLGWGEVARSPAVGQAGRVDNDDLHGLALYLVYRDVAAMSEWLAHTLGFVEGGRSVDAAGVVRNAEMVAGETTLLLERGSLSGSEYPRGTRWTGVWVNDPDEWYLRLRGMHVDAAPPEDEPWGVRLVKVTDPEGHVWALIKRSDH
jgi:PhnB protein